MNLTKEEFYDFINSGKSAINAHNGVKGVCVYYVNKRLKEIRYLLTKDHNPMSSTKPNFMGFITFNPSTDRIEFKVYKENECSLNSHTYLIGNKRYSIERCSEAWEPLSMFASFNPKNMNHLDNGDSFRVYKRNSYYIGERNIEGDFIKSLNNVLDDITSFFNSIEFSSEVDIKSEPKEDVLNIINGLEYAKDLLFFAIDEMDEESYHKLLAYIANAYNSKSLKLKGEACFLYYFLNDTVYKELDYEFLGKEDVDDSKALNYLIEGSEYLDIDCMRTLAAIYSNKDGDSYNPDEAIRLLERIIHLINKESL